MQWHFMNTVSREPFMFRSSFLRLGLLTFCACLLAAVWSTDVFADGKRKQKRRHVEPALAYSVPAVYKDSCGGCHMAYGAYLLPRDSWDRMLKGLDNHFGTQVQLDAAEYIQVADYLLAHSADTGGSRLGRKIMKHTGPETPDRISTMAYIKRRHRKINPASFDNPKVGGIQNCIACHADAEQGDFDDDRARIPRP
jgi:Dihaem cytochrome c.